MGKAKVKKPKPATAGEKIAWDCKGNDSLVYLRTGRGVVVTEAREVSRRIDRAIARAVRKERKRCFDAVCSVRDDKECSFNTYGAKVCLGRALRAIEEVNP